MQPGIQPVRQWPVDAEFCRRVRICLDLVAQGGICDVAMPYLCPAQEETLLPGKSIDRFGFTFTFKRFYEGVVSKR